MNIKLLFLITLSWLFSSCYTPVRYVYVDEPVDEVYIYDVNYVYINLWYDDFYWRYNNSYWYNGLYFYSPRYWAYPYYYNYKPYYRHQRNWRNVGYNQHYRPERRLMTYKTNIKVGHLIGQGVQLKPKKLRQKYYLDTNTRKMIPNSKQRYKVTQRKTRKNVQLKKQHRHYLNTKSSSKNKHKINQIKTTFRSKMKPKFQKRNSSFKNKTSQRNSNPYNKIKKSTKKGRR